jgi:hypothetical protein
MFKEPLMIDKYEALQDLYLKDPLKPLKVTGCMCIILVFDGQIYAWKYKQIW